MLVQVQMMRTRHQAMALGGGGGNRCVGKHYTARPPDGGRGGGWERGIEGALRSLPG